MSEFMNENDLKAAAAELRRLHRVGRTPVRDGNPEDARWYDEHPLRDLLARHPMEPDPRLLVADWLDSLASLPH